MHDLGGALLDDELVAQLRVQLGHVGCCRHVGLEPQVFYGEFWNTIPASAAVEVCSARIVEYETFAIVECRFWITTERRRSASDPRCLLCRRRLLSPASADRDEQRESYAADVSTVAGRG